MCIIDYIFQENPKSQLNNIKFDISKLCCKLCAIAMYSIGCNARKNYRALHGNFYNRWVLPNFIKNDDKKLEKFLGKEAFTIYQNIDNEIIQETILNLIPDKLNIKTPRGATASGNSDSEASQPE